MILAGAGLLVFVILLLQVPAVSRRLAWRYEVARTYARNLVNPVGSVPTAIPASVSTTVCRTMLARRSPGEAPSDIRTAISRRLVAT